MTIKEYQRLLGQYNAAWQRVSELRKHVQEVDAYLGAYGVVNEASRLTFRLDPRTHIDHPSWPSAETVCGAVSQVRELGEQVVSAFNHLPLTDRYLVKLPDLVKS